MATHSRFFSGESHGQRSLAGYSAWGCKESDMTEHAYMPLVREETECCHKDDKQRGLYQ